MKNAKGDELFCKALYSVTRNLCMCYELPKFSDFKVSNLSRDIETTVDVGSLHTLRLESLKLIFSTTPQISR